MDYIADKAKSTAKKAGKRAGEKLIRKIGGDQTRDQQFDDLQFSFDKQVAQSEKFKKDLQRYETILKEVRKAAKGLNDIVADFFEEFWPGTKEFQMCLQDQETLWNDLLRLVHKVNDPLRRYQLQFVDIKERIQKRENKLMDYDICKRSLEKAYNSDKSSGNKIQKLEDAFDDAEKEYQMLNEELMYDLPPVLESRGSFVKEAFMNLFFAHETFSSETFKVQGMLQDIIEGLKQCNLEVSIGRERKGRQRGGGVTRSGQLKGGSGEGGGRGAGRGGRGAGGARDRPGPGGRSGGGAGGGGARERPGGRGSVDDREDPDYEPDDRGHGNRKQRQSGGRSRGRPASGGACRNTRGAASEQQPGAYLM